MEELSNGQMKYLHVVSYNCSYGSETFVPKVSLPCTQSMKNVRFSLREYKWVGVPKMVVTDG